MIHFVFIEKDPRYLFLKYDTEEDEKWLKPNNDKKKQPNLTNHLNLTDPKNSKALNEFHKKIRNNYIDD